MRDSKHIKQNASSPLWRHVFPIDILRQSAGLCALRHTPNKKRGSSPLCKRVLQKLLLWQSTGEHTSQPNRSTRQAKGLPASIFDTQMCMREKAPGFTSSSNIHAPNPITPKDEITPCGNSLTSIYMCVALSFTLLSLSLSIYIYIYTFVYQKYSLGDLWAALWTHWVER